MNRPRSPTPDAPTPTDAPTPRHRKREPSPPPSPPPPPGGGHGAGNRGPAVPAKFSTRKCSLDSVLRPHPEYRDNILDYIDRAHYLAQHATFFIKWWILRALAGEVDFPALDEVSVTKYITMINSWDSLRLKDFEDYDLDYSTDRAIVDEYVATFRIEHQNMTYCKQQAIYLARSIITNLEVNVQEHVYAKVMEYVNKRLHFKTVLKILSPDKSAAGKRRKRRYLQQVRTLKNSINQGLIPQPGQSTRLEHEIATEILSILPYERLHPPPAEGFNLGIDLHTAPEAYVEAYCRLNEMFEAERYKTFNAVPLRRSHVQSTIHIDTTILFNNIVGHSGKNPPKFTQSVKDDMWNKVMFRKTRKIFKGNRQNTMAFGHSVYTDGISVSISMQPPGAKERQHRKKKGLTKAQQKRALDALYFPNHIDELRAAPNIVYVDPNKSDLLYCMDEQGQKLRYTSMQRDKETKRRVFAKKREVRQQELRDLVFPPSKTMNLTAFANFIHFHVQHTTRLKEFYASQDNAHALERLQAYLLKQRSEAKLISAMKSKFGQHFTIVLGDWSDGGHTAKFQTSSKTSGWRKTFTAAKIPW